MSDKKECQQCHTLFEPWRDEDGDLVDDVCWLCDQDNQIQAEIDGQMGG